jgi:aryl-alcohol dehydrogenase-like predicted oxidoreductase
VSVEETFPAEHVIACTEESLKNLGSETIDVQQFHVWSAEWVNRGDWFIISLTLQPRRSRVSAPLPLSDEGHRRRRLL